MHRVSNKAGRQPRLAAEPPRFDNILSYNDFVSCLKELSSQVGINPLTVEKKVPSDNPDSVADATVSKFLEAEELCYVTNYCLLGFPIGQLGEGDLLSLADESIADIGNMHSLDYACQSILIRIVEELNFLVCTDFKPSNEFYLGPGAAQIEAFRSSPYVVDKLDTLIYGCPNCRFSSQDFWSADGDDNSIAHHLQSQILNSTVPDLIRQVPKNKEINRTIGVGSVIGIAAQHCVGNYIRKCLRKRGYDLGHLAEDHRDYAMLMSAERFGATLDFSMASDTLSFGLIWLLLNNKRSHSRCRTLFKLMLNCRADYYSLDGSTRSVYEKFSAMGNSFTFELESLIFTAIARVFTRLLSFIDRRDSHEISETGKRLHQGSSFGDDMILVGSEAGIETAMPLFERLFEVMGLTLNTEKSFWSGPFRESCGADYNRGNFTRGFYLHNNKCYISDLLRAWNFFRLLYGVSEETLRQSKLGYVVKKLRLGHIAFDPGYSTQGFCILMHRIRVPDNVLIMDGGLSTHYYSPVAPSKVRQREISRLANFLIPGILGTEGDRTCNYSPIKGNQSQDKWLRPRKIFPDAPRYYTLPYSFRSLHKDGWERTIEILY